MSEKFKLGYTQGTFDMFHIGHLNLIKNARAHCDKLVVGVNRDELVRQYKKKTPVINEMERLEIVKSIRYVDDAFLCDSLDKVAMHGQCPFDAIFIGDDWKGNGRWAKTEEELAPLGAKVVYLSYTHDISSSLLRIQEQNKVEE